MLAGAAGAPTVGGHDTDPYWRPSPTVPMPQTRVGAPAKFCNTAEACTPATTPRPAAVVSGRRSGSALKVVLMSSKSCPRSLLPQRSTVPSCSNASVWLAPVAKVATPLRSCPPWVTVPGATTNEASAARPACPASLAPHAQSRPLASSAMLWRAPPDSRVTSRPT